MNKKSAQRPRNDFTRQIEKADNYFKRDMPDEARKIYFNVAALLEKSGHSEEARRVYLRGAELLTRMKRSGKAAEMFLRVANSYMNEKNYDGAAPMYANAARTYHDAVARRQSAEKAAQLYLFLAEQNKAIAHGRETKESDLEREAESESDNVHKFHKKQEGEVLKATASFFIITGFLLFLVSMSVGITGYSISSYDSDSIGLFGTIVFVVGAACLALYFKKKHRQ